jgi:hypothetical protein
MKKSLRIALVSIAVLFAGCASTDTGTDPSRYCSFTAGDNGCSGSGVKKGDIICILCETGAGCPDVANKKVKIGIRGNECEVLLGLKNTDCGNCPTGGTKAILLEIEGTPVHAQDKASGVKK